MNPTKSHRVAIAKILVTLGEYYSKPLTEAQLELYVNNLENLSLEEISLATQIYIEDPDSRFFPLPNQLRKLVRPQSEGIDIAGRIVSAISKYGPYQWDAAKEYLGDIAIEIVKRQGGWGFVCSNCTYSNIATLQAQWRDMANSLSSKSHQERITERVKIDESRKSGLSRIGKTDR